MTAITSEVAQFIATFANRSIGDELRLRAKSALLDWLGAALAGSREPGPTRFYEYAASLSMHGNSIAIGRTGRLSEEHAVLHNGIAGHALDFDNSAESVYGFVSSPVAPVCLALGTSQGLNGERVLRAYMVGIELACKLGYALPKEHYDIGWHSTPTIGTLGAAAAGASLLGLDAESTATALGIAASLAGGIRQNYGTDTKPLHAGSAARNGYLAARLAAAGLSADKAILESRYGYLAVFSGGGPIKHEALLRMGEPFEMLEPGLKFRRYPCCAGTHRPLDALAELMRDNRLAPEDVEHIDCGVIYRTVTTLMRSNPTTGLEAKFSLQYCLARMLADGGVEVDDFTDQRVQEPHIRELMRRIRMYVHPEGRDPSSLDRQFAEVEVVLKSGKRLVKRVYAPKGTPQNPLSLPELEMKFASNASRTVSEAAAEAIAANVSELDSLESLETLVRLLTASAD